MSGGDHNQADQTHECEPKTGWLTGDVYCAVHGRAAGWPCGEVSS